MKNNKYIRLLGLLGLFGLFGFFTSCQPRELEFEHEEPQFEIKQNAILIELIAPVGTPADEEIYIFGAFNGLDEDSVIGKVKWQMEKAPASDKKWGIYLFPEDLRNGKTLADGFSFASRRMGGERDINGKPVTHTLNASLGTSNNVSALRWAAYFQTGKIHHEEGPVIYVLDETGFRKLCVYPYFNDKPISNVWPGIPVKGKETVNGIELDYFDMGELYEGLEAYLIFNDNGDNTTQLPAYGPVTLGADTLYLHLTKDGKVEPLSFDGKTYHDGPVLYVLDGLDWGMKTRLHMYASGKDLFGQWPGLEVTGTEKIGRYTYLYFDLGAANEGLVETMILSNRGDSATQLADYGPVTLSGEQYFYISGRTATPIADPENPGDVEWFEPVILPKDSASVDLWFYDATTRTDMYLYAYNQKEFKYYGEWPGKVFAEMDTTVMLGLKLYHAHFDCMTGDTYHLIFNNNGPGEGKAGDWRVLYDIDIDEKENVRYLKLTDGGISELSVVANLPRKE